MIKHERLHTVLLMVFASAIVASVAIGALFESLPRESRPVWQWPQWVHFLSAFLSGLYVCAIAGTLIVRTLQPSIAGRVTRGLNIALLFALPLGTLLGAYGLWALGNGKTRAA